MPLNFKIANTRNVRIRALQERLIREQAQFLKSELQRQAQQLDRRAAELAQELVCWKKKEAALHKEFGNLEVTRAFLAELEARYKTATYRINHPTAP
jgi:hypothetical protein